MAKDMKLKNRFEKEVVPKLMEELGIKNTNAVPRLNKIVVNAGLGSMYTSGTKDFSEFVENFKAITGQKPIVINAKKAISNFKVREGMPNGVMVTLRGDRMYDFIEKLVHIVFPRVRDFRGISQKAFDGNGNYSVGLKEQIVFPEINHDDIVKIHGLQICVNTTAKNNDEGKALLTKLGFPFKKASESETSGANKAKKEAEAKAKAEAKSEAENKAGEQDKPEPELKAEAPEVQTEEAEKTEESNN